MKAPPDCRGIRPLLSAHLDGELAPDAAAAVRTHLATCAACRDELDLLRITVDALRRLPDLPPPAGILEGVRAGIVPEPRLRRLLRSLGGRWWAGIPVGALATLVVVLGIAFFQERIPERERLVITPSTTSLRHEAPEPQSVPIAVPETEPPAAPPPAPTLAEHAPAPAPAAPAPPRRVAARVPAPERPTAAAPIFAPLAPDEGTGQEQTGRMPAPPAGERTEDVEDRVSRSDEAPPIGATRLPEAHPEPPPSALASRAPALDEQDSLLSGRYAAMPEEKSAPKDRPTAGFDRAFRAAAPASAPAERRVEPSYAEEQPQTAAQPEAAAPAKSVARQTVAALPTGRLDRDERQAAMEYVPPGGTQREVASPAKPQAAARLEATPPPAEKEKKEGRTGGPETLFVFALGDQDVDDLREILERHGGRALVIHALDSRATREAAAPVRDRLAAPQRIRRGWRIEAVVPRRGLEPLLEELQRRGTYQLLERRPAADSRGPLAESQDLRINLFR